MMTLNEALETIAAAYNCPDVAVTEAIAVIQLDAYRAGGLAAADFAGFGSANVRAGNRDNILTHFNNPKLEIPK